MNDNVWYVVLFAGIGCFTITGAVANWDWFINSPKASFIAKLLGRNGTRVFYVFLGAALVAFSIYGFFHPEVMHSRRLGT